MYSTCFHSGDERLTIGCARYFKLLERFYDSDTSTLPPTRLTTSPLLVHLSRNIPS